MTYDRFFLLFQHLYFNNNETETSDNRLQKIELIYNDIKENFKSKFRPFKDICIDKNLVLWRERLSFRQYMPQKRHKFGLKNFKICDVEWIYFRFYFVYWYQHSCSMILI